jgi:hypothetical protein
MKDGTAGSAWEGSSHRLIRGGSNLARIPPYALPTPPFSPFAPVGSRECGITSSMPTFSVELVYSVHDPGLAPAPGQTLKFTRGAVELVLGVREIAKARTELVCAASMNTDPAPQVRSALLDLVAGRLPKGSVRSEAKAALDESGRLKPWHVPPMAAMPSSFRQHFDQVFDTLHEACSVWLNMLRWRRGLSEGSLDFWKHISFRFSIDETAWHSIPHSLSGNITFGMFRSSLPVDQELIHEVSEMAKHYDQEPIGHQLFREAWGARSSHPRSALVIGYCALEVGCKDYIASVAPDAAWLAKAIPSPPLDKILKSYIPTLPAIWTIRKKVIIPDRLHKSVRAAMEARNDLAHAGRLSLASDAFETILRDIYDLLWLFDLYAGHRWAFEHVSAETQADLQAPR